MKNKSVTDIAFDVGFNDLSVFSRNFKSNFKMSPADYRKNKYSNNRQTLSNEGQRNERVIPYYCSEAQQLK